MPTKYLTEDQLAEILSETADKIPAKWERKFSIICANKGAVTNLSDVCDEKAGVELQIETAKNPRNFGTFGDTIFDVSFVKEAEEHDTKVNMNCCSSQIKNNWKVK